MRSAQRTVGVIINDLCALRCRHCSLSYTDGYRGTRWQISEADLRDVVHAAAHGPYSVVLMAGGEPALAPQVVRWGVEACREHGMFSAIVTAPMWAKSPEMADRFLDKVAGLNIIMLSYDEYHLEFLTREHYLTAARAARRHQTRTFLNVCQTADRDVGAVLADLTFLDGLIDQVHFQDVLPLGNATELVPPGRPITQVAEVLELKRSCVAGNALLHRDGDVYACCWATRAPDSPFRYARDRDRTTLAPLKRLDEDPTLAAVIRDGLIDSLSPAALEEVVGLLRGRSFVNECDLCVTLMRLGRERWRTLFPRQLLRRAGTRRGLDPSTSGTTG